MSYTRLCYHLVTATKNRMPTITAEVEGVLYPALHLKAQDCGARILQAGGVEDHIHLVVAMPPTIALADFVREIKTRGSRAVNQAGFHDGTFQWQRGYGGFTLNPHDLSRIIRYVANQKEHHATGRVWAAYEQTPSER